MLLLINMIMINITQIRLFSRQSRKPRLYMHVLMSMISDTQVLGGGVGSNRNALLAQLVLVLGPFMHAGRCSKTTCVPEAAQRQH